MACQSGRRRSETGGPPGRPSATRRESVSAKRSLVWRSLQFWARGGRPAVRLRETTWYRESPTPPRSGRSCGELVFTSSRRNARKGVDRGPSRFKVRAGPPRERASQTRSKSRSCDGGRLAVGCCCDALRCSGPHARYTDEVSEFYSSNSPWPEGLGNLVKLHRAGDRALQLLLFNEEFLVVAIHQIATITSLPFVHTARRYYRLNGLVRPLDRLRLAGNGPPLSRSRSNLVI